MLILAKFLLAAVLLVPLFFFQASSGKASDHFIVEKSGFPNMICDGEK